jgi:crotonobetainyl-CoA:carnitine CoA-transferase CaiB-like acyl-CoA transferase
MSAWCASRSCAEALTALEKASIVAGQVYSPQQALDDRHIRAAGLLEEVTFPGINGTLPLAPHQSSSRKPPAPTAAGRRWSANTLMRSSRASGTTREKSPHCESKA